MALTAEQITQLLRPINPRRVLQAEGQSHVSQQDIRAHLTRIFGFGGWDKEILELRCVRDTTITVPGKNGRPAREGVPAVTYVCRMRLTVRDPDGNVVKVSEDVGTGTSPNLPGFGDAHDFAAKNAVSYALKRCATDLGDQFGLSLYNKGQVGALVGVTLVRPGAGDAGDVEADVPQQVSMGHTEGGDLPNQQDQPDEPAKSEADQARDMIRESATAMGMDLSVVARAYLRTRKTELRGETDLGRLREFLADLAAAAAIRGEIRALAEKQAPPWNLATIAQGYAEDFGGRSFVDETDPEPLGQFFAKLRADAGEVPA